MARANARRQKSLTGLSDIILAEWYRVLAAPGASMDAAALTTAFNQILDPTSPCQVILDEPGAPIKIVVPLPPVSTLDELDDYVLRNKDFRNGMGVALVFGCGK